MAVHSSGRLGATKTTPKSDKIIRVLIAHLSDLHLKEPGDLWWLERQLDRVAARSPAHLAITGDLLDRWDTRLLERALDALESRGFMRADRPTIFHGNHDLASSGGHPRTGADLRRLVLRFWDPPPLVKWRRRRFYKRIHARAEGVGVRSPTLKTLRGGLRLAVLDTVPIPWKPVSMREGTVEVHHAIGCVRGDEMAWLSGLRAATPLVVLMHHYPLDAPLFAWSPDRHDFQSAGEGLMKRFVRQVAVPMAIPEPDRSLFWAAATAAETRLVLCGHVHRQRFEWNEQIAVGLNGQSGAAWAGRTIAFYDLGAGVTVELEEIRE